MDPIESRRSKFRNAMARLSAAVNVVTSNGPAGRCGITATAVCSVSDTPPTLLICLNRASAMNQVFKRNRDLCINVLNAGQEEQARLFAGMTNVTMEQRFNAEHWGEDAWQVPLLKEALANLSGRIIRSEEIGSHTVMIVEIKELGLQEEGMDGLVYFDRLFHRVPCKQTALVEN
jgi:flavin reductase (NADH)